MKKYVAVSGGFDPIHVGHVRMIQTARAKHGPVMIILNSDAWLLRKKGYIFMPWEERAEILRAISGVEAVVPVDDSDGSVCEALRTNASSIYAFANGGDRVESQKNPLEDKICQDEEIFQLFNVGGGKIQSSSELVRNSNAKVHSKS